MVSCRLRAAQRGGGDAPLALCVNVPLETTTGQRHAIAFAFANGGGTGVVDTLLTGGVRVRTLPPHWHTAKQPSDTNSK